MQMINVSAQILKFRDFLVHSWNDLDLLMTDHDWDEDGGFIGDWLQVNWEFLVERELLKKNEFLKPYEYDNFRITHLGAVATYEIICKPVHDKPLVDARTLISISKGQGLAFGGFVKKTNGGGYGCYPPFDFVTVFTLNRKQFYQIPVVDVDFYLSPIDLHE